MLGSEVQELKERQFLEELVQLPVHVQHHKKVQVQLLEETPYRQTERHIAVVSKLAHQMPDNHPGAQHARLMPPVEVPMH